MTSTEPDTISQSDGADPGGHYHGDNVYLVGGPLSMVTDDRQGCSARGHATGGYLVVSTAENSIVGNLILELRMIFLALTEI